MNTAPLQFQCPHCSQLLEMEVLPDDCLVQCPTCGGEAQIAPPTPVARGGDEGLMSPAVGNAGRLAFAALIGAGVGYVLTYSLWVALVGALCGWLYGTRRNRQRAGLLANDPRWKRRQALTGLKYTIVAWVLITGMWSWVLTRPPEMFHDQGGMLLTLFVFPLTLVLWILGGPVAFARGWANRWRLIEPGLEPWVLCGLILSALLTVGAVAFVFVLVR